MPLPDACCDCTCESFCKQTAFVIRRPDGSFDPPKVPRLVQRPGPDGTDVPVVEYDWLLLPPDRFGSEPNGNLAGVNTHACAWNLVAGSHALAAPGNTPSSILRPQLDALLATVGLSRSDVQVPSPSTSVAVVNAAISDRTIEEQAAFWDDLIAAGFRELFNYQHVRDIDLRSQGTVLTRTTRNRPVQVVELRITATTREDGDTSGTPFTFDPLTTDVRIGCDEAGANPQYTLRVRVEHGEQIEPVTYATGFDGPITDPGRYFFGSSSWGDAELECHTLIPHSQQYTGQFQSGVPISAIEARIYLEVLDDNGTALESVRVPAFNYRRASFFGGVGVRWSWSISDGQIHVNANVSFVLQSAGGEIGTTDAEDQNGTDPNQISIGLDRVLRHLFAPRSLTQAARIAVALPAARRHSVRVRHRQFRFEAKTTSNGLPLSPVLPSDVSPYCDAGHPDYQSNQQPSRWPWRKTNCTVWRRHGGRATQGIPSLSECVLTITGDPDFALTGAYRQESSLIAGSYNLGSVTGESQRLADNCFWFSDEPDSSYSFPVSEGVSVPGGTLETREYTATMHLRRIEFSLTLGATLSLPCNGGWGVAAYLRGRAVFEQTVSGSPQSPYLAFPPRSMFFGETLSLPEAFLRGEVVNAVNSLPQSQGQYLSTGNRMQWYFGGPGDPFVRAGGANSFFGGPLDMIMALTNLNLQLVP